MLRGRVQLRRELGDVIDSLPDHLCEQLAVVSTTIIKIQQEKREKP